jgi:hypothetical protein
MKFDEWQTWAALAVLAMTLGLFARALLRSRKNRSSGCGGGCHCTVKDKVAPQTRR